VSRTGRREALTTLEQTATPHLLTPEPRPSTKRAESKDGEEK